MSASQIVGLSLWCAQPVVQSAVAITLWRRKLHEHFPYFFAYLITQIVIFAIEFPLQSHYNWYFYVFWCSAAVNAALGFKIIHEIFVDVFRQYHTLRDLGTVVFRWAGAVMLLVAIVVALSTSFDLDPLAQAVTSLQRSVRLVQFGLVLFLLLFSRFLGMSRRQLSFGIALGFGLFAGIELLLLALHSGHLLHDNGFNVANMAAYNFAICTWFSYSLSRDAIRRPVTNSLQTQRWEQGLSDRQHPLLSDSPGSLIPMFESMVERAITRSSNVNDLSAQTMKLERPKAFSAASSGGGSKAGR